MTEPTDDKLEHARSLWGGKLDRPWKVILVIGTMFAIYAAITYAASM